MPCGTGAEAMRERPLEVRSACTPCNSALTPALAGAKATYDEDEIEIVETKQGVPWPSATLPKCVNWRRCSYWRRVCVSFLVMAI